MIKRTDLMALNFYKKSALTGSIGGMSYRIARVEDEATKEVFFHVVYWPGPYSFAKTEENRKQSAKFPFDEDGICAVADYLNAQYIEQKALWDTVRFV